MRERPGARLRERRRKARTFKYGSIAVLIIFCAGLCAYAVRLPAITISEVQVEAGPLLAADVIKARVEEKLNGSYVFLVPRRMSFAVPMGAIQDELGALPEVASVSIRRDGLRTLVVTITERGPYATWCATECFGMDHEGFMFAPATAEVGRVYRGGEGGIGTRFLDGRFSAFDSFLNELEHASSREILSVRIASNDDVFAELQGGGEIRFVMNKDTTLSSVASVFAAPGFSDHRLRYADFRFDQKAVVQFVNGAK